VPERARQTRGEDSYFLVASLFAIHPEHAAAGNFGGSMWRIATDGGNEPSPSADLRFRRILEAEREDLAAHLRQAVRLAATRSTPVAIDYHRLLSDLLWWEHPERRVQRAWARAYWTPQVSTANQGE
jgi:CRISPR system Cascade subunit CasB